MCRTSEPVLCNKICVCREHGKLAVKYSGYVLCRCLIPIEELMTVLYPTCWRPSQLQHSTLSDTLTPAGCVLRCLLIALGLGEQSEALPPLLKVLI